jgi:hypothetical protein
MNPGMLMSMAG